MTKYEVVIHTSPRELQIEINNMIQNLHAQPVGGIAVVEGEPSSGSPSDTPSHLMFCQAMLYDEK